MRSFFHWAAQLGTTATMAVRLDYNRHLSMAIYASTDLF